MKVVVAGLVCVAFALCASGALAADVTLTGTVGVTKNDDGAVTAVKLTVKDGDKTVVYSVVLDDNGKKLADLAGKNAKVTGTVEEKEDVKTLTVKTSEEVKVVEEK